MGCRVRYAVGRTGYKQIVIIVIMEKLRRNYDDQSSTGLEEHEVQQVTTGRISTRSVSGHRDWRLRPSLLILKLQHSILVNLSHGQLLQSKLDLLEERGVSGGQELVENFEDSNFFQSHLSVSTSLIIPPDKILYADNCSYL